MKWASIAAAAAAILVAASQPAWSQKLDVAAAEALAKKSKCLTCHSVSQKKDAPSYREIAAKYKGKGDAEKKLYAHLTSNPKVKVDGKEEEHDSLRTKDQAEVYNVIRWIMSR